jgi:hypothetical protein
VPPAAANEGRQPAEPPGKSGAPPQASPEQGRVERDLARHPRGPGDPVVASVWRPGSRVYDRIELQDVTTDDTCFERGIHLRHGNLAEYCAERAESLVKVAGRAARAG